MVVLVRVLLSRLFNSHHLVLLDEAFPASFWKKSIMMAEKRLLQDIEKAVVGDTDTDEAKVKKHALISLSLSLSLIYIYIYIYMFSSSFQEKKSLGISRRCTVINF